MTESIRGRTAPARATVIRDSQALTVALDRLVRAYQFRDRQRACYRGLSINECYALSAVIRDKGLTQGGLAAELVLDKSTTSRLVDALESRGYLTREPDPCDGRAYRLRTTEKGRRLHAKIQQDLLRRQRHLIEDLPATARRAAVLVLSRLADDAAERFRESR